MKEDSEYVQLVKSLRWLANMFPEVHPAEDDADRMRNNIHLYCSKAADAIEELTKRVMLAPIDSYAGLKRKYIVLKADTGKDVPDCFVLRPAKDKAAVEALRAYAKATDNDLLAADIYRWVGPLPEPPKEANNEL